MNRSASVFFGLVLGLCATAPSGAARAATQTVLYSFCTQQSCTDSALPNSGIIDLGGTLYGTTVDGGDNLCGDGSACGTVFSLDPQSGAAIVLHSFNETEAWQPSGGVVEAKGVLYGTTGAGGGGQYCGGAHMFGCGAIFSLDLANDEESVLYPFCSQPGCSDGDGPTDGVVSAGTMLYGTTGNGGLSGCHRFGCGVIFSFDPKSSTENAIYSFSCSMEDCSNGTRPSGLTDVSGVLYGTTFYGDAGAHCANYKYPCGTVFSFDPTTNAKTVLYSFCSKKNCRDGSWAETGVINVGGVLYGLTVFGGARGEGTIFSLDPTTGAETVLYSFCSQKGCKDGANPGGLVFADGKLFGVTASGGSGAGNCIFYGGCGTVFSFDLKTATENVLYSFCNQQNCIDGADPNGLIDVKGALYGTTEAGGAGANCTTTGGCGTVFSITP